MNTQPKKLANFKIEIGYNTVRSSPSKFKHTNKKSMTPTSRPNKLL